MMALQFCPKSFPVENKKRKRREGRSNNRGKDTDTEKYLSKLKKVYGGAEQGSDKSHRNKRVERMWEDSEVNDCRLSEDSDTDGDIDDDEDIEINGRSISEDSVQYLSSFDLHLQHTLSNEEIENQRNLEYKWEAPAIGMSNCKWIGTGQNIFEDLDTSTCDGLRPKWYRHWMDVYGKFGDKAINSPKQKMFFSLCSSYRDILHCSKRPFYQRVQEDTSIMHSLNHVLRTRDLGKKNDAKLAKSGQSDRFRDQGFTRPKVLILLPFASTVFRVVKRLIQLTPSCKLNVEHMDRFSAKFGSEEGEGNDEMGENGQESGNANSRKSYKGSDFQVLFGGNNEDKFMIAIKFTRSSMFLFRQSSELLFFNIS